MSKVYSDLKQDVESNMTAGTSHKFQIKDTSKIINILRDGLYKHKQRTLVQEYVSNARDAVREKYKNQILKANPKLDPNNYSSDKEQLDAVKKLRAEIEKKIKLSDIKVTIPSRINPFFKVRDYGVGLSPDRVANVFTYYCESTKGDSNIETGGFGIGGKSAWAYTSHFTVISFYEGKKYTYTSHTEKEEGELCLDDVCDTTEANGVEIVVAVKQEDLTIFLNSVLRICYFWKVRPTLTGLHAADIPEWFDKEADLSFGPWQIFTKEWCNDVTNNRVFQDDPTSFIFILDGVPYAEGLPVNLQNELTAITQHYSRRSQRVIVTYNATLEDANVTASRENLAKTPKTLEFLKNLSIKKPLKDYYLSLDKEINTPKERINLFYKFHKILGEGFLKETLEIGKNLEYKKNHFTYKLLPLTYAEVSLAVDQNLYTTFLIHIKRDINDKIVVSIGNRTTVSTVALTDSGEFPFLVQDEILSVTNRRLKIIEFHKKTKLNDFILVMPLNEDEKEGVTQKLAKEPQELFELELTSNFELIQSERAEIKRATGVYTLYQINYGYGRYSKEKVQQAPDFFDKVKTPFLIMSEEDFKKISDVDKTLMKNLEKLGAKLYIGAPSTISKIENKPNIHHFKAFIKKIDKHLTLPEEAISFLHRTYFAKLEEIINQNYSVFFNINTSSMMGSVNTIKDPLLKSALTKSEEFLQTTKHSRGYYQLNLSFLETHFPKITNKIKELDFNQTYRDLSSKKIEYPLISSFRDERLSADLVIYINAKYEKNKK